MQQHKSRHLRPLFFICGQIFGQFPGQIFGQFPGQIHRPISRLNFWPEDQPPAASQLLSREVLLKWGGMGSRSGRAVRTVKGGGLSSWRRQSLAHHRTPMAAAKRDIFIIAAYLNLCAILYHLPAGIGANHHHRLAPAMADCPDLAQIVRQRQQRG